MNALRRVPVIAAGCLLFFVFSGTVPAAAEDPEVLTARIPIQCMDFSGGQTHTYEIRIAPENTASPAPLSDTLSVAEDGTEYFELHLTEPGTFVYRIYEQAGNDPVIRYDQNVYHITVEVVNNENGGLIYSVTASENDKKRKTDRIIFRNNIMAEQDIDPTEMPVTAPGGAVTGITDVIVTAPPPTDQGVTDIMTTAPTQTGPGAASPFHPLPDPAVPASADAPAVPTAAPTETTATVTTAAVLPADPPPASPDAPVSDTVAAWIGNVLTGDSFPAHTVRFTLLVSFLTAVSAFLFKRNKNEEEDEHDA